MLYIVLLDYWCDGHMAISMKLIYVILNLDFITKLQSKKHIQM